MQLNCTPDLTPRHICSSGLVSILKFNLSVNHTLHQVPHKEYYYSFSMCVIGWSLIWLTTTICWSSLLANWMPVNSNSIWDLFKVICLIIIMQLGYKGLPSMKKQILSVYWLTKVHNVSNINIFNFKSNEICSEWIYPQRFMYFRVCLPPSNWQKYSAYRQAVMENKKCLYL